MIVDSQSVKGAETVSKATRGFDAGKKINGCKRHIAVDTLGLPLMITVTLADTTAGTPPVNSLATSRHAAPDHPGLGRLRPRRPAHQLVQRLPQHDLEGRLPPSRSTRVRRPGPTLESRTNPGLDHEVPAQRPRLRATPTALRSPPDLGPDDPQAHPERVPAQLVEEI
ncbi:transposase [Streptomyces sp. NPDC059862]|uniref:transposase n=1 Tax=unclassified Streptomyces TaxID=2593676 RepID=UPI003629BE59